MRSAAAVAILVLAAAGCSERRLAVDREILEAAPPQLVERVRANPYTYFRLINDEWTARVCERLAAVLVDEPTVQLHGDAHVEQFAFMKDAWGLDDFDDSARGPALVDIVRFLGSIDLATRGRGWLGDRDRLYQRFLEGYRRGLANPAYRPPAPAIVRRGFADAPPISPASFLEWAEGQMVPMTDEAMTSVITAMKIFDEVVRADHPDLAAGYFHVVRAGWLQIGVGSVRSLKVLMRVEGPSDDPSDDVLLEAKAVRTRGPMPCLETPTSQPTVRIVRGTRQIGRLEHEILAAGPEVAVAEAAIRGRQLREWWIRSWDPSYHEISLGDLQSVDDLMEVVYDAGVQLGAGTLHGVEAADATKLRTQMQASIDAAEPRFRPAIEDLVAELLRGWHDIGGH